MDRLKLTLPTKTITPWWSLITEEHFKAIAPTAVLLLYINEMDDDFIGLLLSLRRHVRNVGFGNSRAWSFLPECVDILMWRTSGHVHHRPGITYIFPMPFRYITFFYSYDCCSSLMHVTCYIGYIYSIHNIMSLIGVCSSADICSSKIGNYIFLDIWVICHISVRQLHCIQLSFHTLPYFFIE